MVKSSDISEAKIRQAIWMLKKYKTKKLICEHICISYSPKKLDAIIDDFHKRIEREKELKTKARFKKFSETEMKSMADDYLSGDGLTAIAQRNFISPQRVKKFLMELNVPLRGRGKKSEAKVDHIIQNLEVKFKIGDKVLIAKNSQFAKVKEVFDEDWVEEHRNPTRRRYIELHAMKDARKKYGQDFEGKEDIHWQIYWQYENGGEWKESAIKYRIHQIESILEQTGRESYRLYVEGDAGHFVEEHRNNLYPVMANGN